MPDHAAAVHDAVIDLLRQAAERSPRPEKLLFQLSEALSAAGRDQEAADVFRRAYLARPDSSLFVPGPNTDPRRLRARARALIAHGAIFSPVIAALAVADVMLGEASEVRRLVDYDRFCRWFTVEPPRTFAGIDFNAALATEIKADLVFYGGADTTKHLATRGAWRNNNVLTDRSPACLALAEIVRESVHRYTEDLPDDTDHPFVASRPASFVLEGWAIVSDGSSYLEPHLHPRAWLSAVYYVAQPAASRDIDSRRGWLRLGLPAEYGLDPSGGWDERMLEPESGRLLLMPGYFLHGTSPIGPLAGGDERISMAFDVVPAEIAAASPRTARH
jgi:hypothetical protein